MGILLTSRVRGLCAGVVTIAALGACTPIAEAWSPPGAPTLFVNGSLLSGYGSSPGTDPGGAAGTAEANPCDTAPYTTINTAVASATTPRTRIVVCPGTYKEDVTVSDVPVDIQGVFATVDASGLPNGFTLVGPGAAGSTVEGFTIQNAVGEGVIATNTSNVTILDSIIQNNDKGVRQPGYEECEATPQNEFPDCGEGVHLMGTSHSLVFGDIIRGNSGGVLLTDETGPSGHNSILRNRVVNNVEDCGITLAGHNPAAAPGGMPNPSAAGVYANLISENVVEGNGVAGQGAGVLLAAGLPAGGGGVYENTVSWNLLRGNGLAGVTLHNHVPEQDLNGNRIVYNHVATNNLDGDFDFPVADPVTTGVFVGTAGAPLAVTIEHNLITLNEVGVFLTGPMSTEDIGNNTFFLVAKQVVGP